MLRLEADDEIDFMSSDYLIVDDISLFLDFQKLPPFPSHVGLDIDSSFYLLIPGSKSVIHHKAYSDL